MYVNVFIVYLQEIKRKNDEKGIASCKIALYRAYLKYGKKTWEHVVTALEKSNHDEISEHVKLQLLKNYNKVNKQSLILHCNILVAAST